MFEYLKYHLCKRIRICNVQEIKEGDKIQHPLLLTIWRDNKDAINERASAINMINSVNKNESLI